MKKKLLSLLLTSIAGFSASAYDFCVDGIYYTITSTDEPNTCEVAAAPEAICYSNDVTIPASVTNGTSTYSVTSIGNGAFSLCSALTSVTIPNSVIAISEMAFSECQGLTSVNIPSSVTSIGDMAFLGCTGLTSVTIPNSVTSIGNLAFGYCIVLTSVTIPGSVNAIGNCAFGQCTGLSEFNGKFASDDHRCLIVDGTLNSFAPSGLTTYSIPASVISIGSAAFYGCRGLTEVIIPNSVTSICNEAFKNCTGLTAVTIPGSVIAIDDWAFCECSGLTSIAVDNENPANISLGYAVFAGTPKSSCVLYVPDGSKDLYAAADQWRDFANIEEKSYLIYEFTDGSQTAYKVVATSADLPAEVIIPATHNGLPVTAIGDFAFERCHELSSVTILNSITSIGNGAFESCHGLTSVTIPNSVTLIGGWAFSECHGLTTVTIPNSVTAIGNGAFAGCLGLTSVTIPYSVTAIGDWTFRGCSGLTSITVENDYPASTSLGAEVFLGVPTGTCVLYVPDGSKTLYAAADQWSDFANIEEETLVGINYEFTDDSRTAYKVVGHSDNLPAEITIPATHNGLPVTAIGHGAFSECHGLTSVTIPNSVTAIGDFAFAECSGLTSIGIPESVTAIGMGAFERCTGLTSVTIPNSVTAIGNGAFAQCRSMTSVTIPNSVTAIGDFAFGGCPGLSEFNGKFASDDHRFLIVDGTLNSFAPFGLTSYSIPSSVTSIGDYAFLICNRLTSLTIPDSVTSIGDFAFRGCSNLPSLTIPGSVTAIGDSAFELCYGLTSIAVENDDPANISLGFDVFFEVPVSTCVLYVPQGSKSLYAAADQWKDFVNINEGGMSAIKTIGADNIDADIYYDLMGRRVDNPTHGIYIHAGKKVLVK